MLNLSNDSFLKKRLLKHANKFSIGLKVVTIAFIPFALMMLAHLFSQFEKEAISNVSLANHLEARFSHARLHEAEFLAKKDKKSFLDLQAATKAFTEEAEKLSDTILKAETANMIHSYFEIFTTCADMMNEQGLDHSSGAQGRLREAIHLVEKMIKDSGKDEWLIPVLTLRRHEKDYLLRGNEKYIQKWNETFNNFNQTVSNSEIDSNEKQALFTALSNYDTNFESWINLNQQIAEQNAALNALGVKLEEKLDAFEISMEKEAGKNMFFARGVFFIALIVSIVIVYLGKIAITEPIIALQKVADEVTGGNHDVEINCEARDEIGQLSRSFSTMLTKVMQLLTYLKKLPNPTMVIDKDFTIEFMSNSGLELLNKQKDKVVGKKCYDIFKTHDCHTENCACAQAMKSNQLITRENIAQLSGAEVPIVYSGSPLKNQSDEITGAIENITLFTEIKEREDYLKRSVQTMLTEMENVAQGNLDIDLQAEKSGDNVAALFAGFQKAITNIRSMMLEVVDASTSLASAVEELSTSSQEIATGTQEQSSQTHEIASAIEEMTSTLQESSKNISAVETYSREAGSFAKQGVEKVNESKTGIEHITKSAHTTGTIISSLSEKTNQIGEVTQVIDEIADQTNLLALNAAIEAARAGEQGRGFAVVADEVRKLAERTTTATREIAEMIKSVQLDANSADNSMQEARKSVEAGTKINEELVENLNQIFSAAEKVADEISQISAASREQAGVATEISNNVEMMNQVSNQSAAGVEQIATTAQSLGELTQNLHSLVNQFSLGKQEQDFGQMMHQRQEANEFPDPVIVD
ncbi:MAG: HAMP domain-containing protein [Calditrichaeota bacterium]|nr:MAG: HAMP domain-containing protein [Calditrichota bacterium]